MAKILFSPIGGKKFSRRFHVTYMQILFAG